MQQPQQQQPRTLLDIGDLSNHLSISGMEVLVGELAKTPNSLSAVRLSSKALKNIVDCGTRNVRLKLRPVKAAAELEPLEKLGDALIRCDEIELCILADHAEAAEDSSWYTHDMPTEMAVCLRRFPPAFRERIRVITFDSYVGYSPCAALAMSNALLALPSLKAVVTTSLRGVMGLTTLSSELWQRELFFDSVASLKHLESINYSYKPDLEVWGRLTDGRSPQLRTIYMHDCKATLRHDGTVDMLMVQESMSPGDFGWDLLADILQQQHTKPPPHVVVKTRVFDRTDFDNSVFMSQFAKMVGRCASFKIQEIVLRPNDALEPLDLHRLLQILPFWPSVFGFHCEDDLYKLKCPPQVTDCSPRYNSSQEELAAQLYSPHAYNTSSSSTSSSKDLADSLRLKPDIRNLGQAVRKRVKRTDMESEPSSWVVLLEGPFANCIAKMYGDDSDDDGDDSDDDVDLFLSTVSWAATIYQRTKSVVIDSGTREPYDQLDMFYTQGLAPMGGGLLLKFLDQRMVKEFKTLVTKQATDWALEVEMMVTTQDVLSEACEKLIDQMMSKSTGGGADYLVRVCKAHALLSSIEFKTRFD